MSAAPQKLAAWLAIAICLSCGAPVRIGPSIDDALASVTDRPFSGAMMLAEGTRVVYAKSAGNAARDPVVPLTLSSRFVVGSLTKQVTASLVLQQVDAGRVSLDAPIATYIELGADWTKRVKVRHLLNHTSGIGALDAPLETEPGSTFAYSNLGYELLGSILEKVTARSYSDLATALFQSCGMTQSQILRLGDTPGLVEGYSEQPDHTLVVASQAERAQHLPPGGMVSTVSDLVRWNQCLHHGKILSPASYLAMVTPSTKRSYRWGSLGYGFGLQIAEPEGAIEYSHSGYVLGFISTMTYYPATDRTFVALENVSWDAENIDRVFAQHDAVRKLVLQSLSKPWPRSIRTLDAPTDKTPIDVNKETLVSPTQSPDARHRATGTFEIKMTPQPPYDSSDGIKLARSTISKTFHGQLEATSSVEMLSAMTSVEGSAGYVAIERVVGTLDGRAGSFIAQHNGAMARGEASLSVTIVPDSGTGALSGIAGRMTIEIVDKKHLYTLDYTLPAAE